MADGGTIAAVSESGGNQSVFKVTVRKEYEKDVWWLIYGDNGAITVVGAKLKSVSPEQELLIEERLQQFNKPAAKSIQSEDGDIIDCVDIYKQPALDHPLLKNHIIEVRPDDQHSPCKIYEASSSSTDGLFTQVWQRSGSCPIGTIPIVRVQRHHLLNTPSIQNYGRKPWNGVKKHAVRLSNNETFDLNAENLHAYGGLLGTGDDILGAKAIINLWNPSVQQDSEYSSAKIWLRNGPTDRSNNIEAGWMVNPSVSNDRTVRIFTYWTADSGRTTGCFNVLCPGFVQTSDKIALGASFSNVSTTGGRQFEFRLTVRREEESGKWWLVYGDNSTIGYWPTSLFDTLNDSATTAFFGGDVYSPVIHEKPHPSTGMGSGGYANGHFAYAAYIRLPRVQYGSPQSRYPDPYGILTTQSGCYSAENYAERLWKEPRIYFGGPGRSDPDCP
ncbi:hypothetical protein OPV22_032800 [Ensete ventricosum]|uniref:Neprosin PEP catalytic domain-containing protein n=1 Tax=Ensete ventricosum TaxID=4639 RepID=A0AAV8PSJ3_ENSVE|nr:hypothetical protein OPV22_032800 [Ensete ventricosum]